MDAFNSKSLKLERPAIRLMQLCRGEGPELECHLFDAWFDDDESLIPYEALSYVWGSLDTTHHINIGDTRLGITENLHEALTHLRLPDEDRIMWVDAICIDQKNVHERSHQVQQMGRIYKTAQNVVFWLGAATYDTDVAMESVRKLQEASNRISCQSWGPDDPQWTQLWDFVKLGLRARFPGLEDAQEAGMRELRRRPWFRRVWILQEVANARRAVVQCSKKSVRAGLFALAPRLMMLEDDLHFTSVLDIMPGSLRPTSWWAQSSELYTLLRRSRGASSSDPRDLVYALLGMASDLDLHPSVRADYTKHPDQLVRDICNTLFFGLIPQKEIERIRSVKDLLVWLPTLNNTAIKKLTDQWHTQSIDMAVTLCRRGYLERDNVARVLGKLIEQDEKSAVRVRPHEWNTVRLGAYLRQIQNMSSEDQIAIEVRNLTDSNCFLQAASDRYFNVMRFLVGIEDSQGTFATSRMVSWALHVAVREAEHETMASLLALGVDIESRDGEGRTLLCQAARQGRNTTVKFLLDHGADINAQDRTRMTPLRYAIENGDKDLVETLIDSGADLRKQGTNELDPLVVSILQESVLFADRTVL
jgi:hypothetical protein